MRVLLAAWVVLLQIASAAEAPRPPQATEGRFDLYGHQQVGSLDNPRTSEPDVSVSRPAWMKPADRARGLSVQFPMEAPPNRTISVSFVPRSAGRITLSLLGPPPQPRGEATSAETVWDALDLQGGTWAPESKALLRPPIRSSFKQRYDLTMRVEAGVTVTLGVKARPGVVSSETALPATTPLGSPPSEVHSPGPEPGKDLSGVHEGISLARAKPSTEPSSRQGNPAGLDDRSPQNARILRWGVAGLLISTALIYGLTLFRRRPHFELAPLALVLPHTSEGRVPREQTAAQLAEMMREKLVSRLLKSRREADAIHRQAVQEMAEMERRLESLHLPIQGRLAAYEQRIVELQEDLERMGEQNRQLIQAKIDLTRQRLLPKSEGVGTAELD